MKTFLPAFITACTLICAGLLGSVAWDMFRHP